MIAVRVSSMISIVNDGGLIGPAEAMKLSTEGISLPLTGVWRCREVADCGTVGMTFMRTLGAGEFNSLHMVYDNAIHPLAPYALRGAIFYQGEANGICMAHTYQSLLEAMIADWRRLWAQEQFDFTVIQLPEFGPRNLEAFAMGRIREAQALSARAAPRSGCDARPRATATNLIRQTAASAGRGPRLPAPESPEKPGRNTVFRQLTKAGTVCGLNLKSEPALCIH